MDACVIIGGGCCAFLLTATATASPIKDLSNGDVFWGISIMSPSPSSPTSPIASPTITSPTFFAFFWTGACCCAGCSAGWTCSGAGWTGFATATPTSIGYTPISLYIFSSISFKFKSVSSATVIGTTNSYCFFFTGSGRRLKFIAPTTPTTAPVLLLFSSPTPTTPTTPPISSAPPAPPPNINANCPWSSVI